MSAVHLHNTLYQPQVAESQSNFPHSRNLSTISSVTLQTNTTSHSQPHEPLLPQNGGSEQPYYDVSPADTRPNLLPSRNNYSTDKTLAENDKKDFLSSLRRRPLSGMRRLKIGLDIIIAIWALYTTVRYFLAFSVYESVVGQTVSLILGTCSGLSFSFLICAIAISSFRPQLLRRGLSYGSISTLYWCLTYIALLLMFAPAAVNLAFVFVWRSASDLQLDPKHRCFVDIDLVWAKTTHRLCKLDTIPWGVWVTLSSLRLAVTSATLLGYQFVLYKLSQTNDVLAQRFRGKHRINPSDLFSYHSALPTESASGVPFPPGPSSPTSMMQSQPRNTSQSSLSSRTKISTTHRQLTRSYSSGLSGAGGAVSQAGSKSLAAVPEQHDVAGPSHQFSSLVSQIEQETEDALRFARSATSDETMSRSEHSSIGEEAEEYLRRQLRQANQGSPHDNNEDDDENDDYEDDFYNSATPRTYSSTPTLGYNEFGQPYPPDQDVPMMNGYIRRMPTIESMGSREIGSSVAASSLRASLSHSYRDFDKRGSMQTTRSQSNSRPPTRNARGSWGMGSDVTAGTGSEPSSRTNSLSYQVEKLAAAGFLGGRSSGGSGGSVGGHSLSGHNNARVSPHWPSELGELDGLPAGLQARQKDKQVDEGGLPQPPGLTGLEKLFVPPGKEASTYSESTGGSQSTAVSYFTAGSGSARSRDETRAATPASSMLAGEIKNASGAEDSVTKVAS